MWHPVARSVTLFFCCREALRDMYGRFPHPDDP